MTLAGQTTNVQVPNICFGTAPLGSMPNTYGYAVSEEQAYQTVEAILTSDAPFLDTSRNYGDGRSEERIGAAIKRMGGLPEGAVISTKLDRDMETRRFDADRARRSLEESLSVLGIAKIDVLHLHDPEYARDLDEVSGALDALFKMKEEGFAGAVGLAMGRIDLMSDLLNNWDFDTLISHNRFTLVNREADQVFDLAHRKGTAIFNAAPYAGGVLAKGANEFPRYVYQEADEAALAPVRQIETICAEYNVPIGAVALQFSMRDPRIASTICGVSKPERVAQTLDWANHEIPQAAWQALAAVPYSSEDPEASRIYDPG
ncbi:MAG: aldo/keto reductase [Stappiaceae bacterium]